MQVRSKDSKHLFSLDNLLDFLHKKADITDCLKQHHLLCRIHDTCFRMKMCGDGTDTETKTVRKKQGRGRRGREQYSVNLSFHWMNHTGTTLPSGLLSTPAWDVRIACNKPSPGYQGQMMTNAWQTLCKVFPFVFFNMWGGQRGRWWQRLSKECQG